MTYLTSLTGGYIDPLQVSVADLFTTFCNLMVGMWLMFR